MEDSGELEIRIDRQYANNYPVEVRFTQAQSDVENDLAPTNAAPLQLDLGRLRDLEPDPYAYGQALTQMLFGGWVGDALTTARRNSMTLDTALRVRLFITPSAWDLHSLRWETLRDPASDDPLLTSERLLFSRFLSSDDWRRVQRRSQSDLRALVVIANPTGLEKYAPAGRPLFQIDVERELGLARAGLNGMAPQVLTHGDGAPASIVNVAERLRDGFDVLYLVCHGAFVDGEPWLWLEDENGAVDVVSGRQLVTRLREVVQVPRLVVLASCQSGGSGEQSRSLDGGALAALGPEVAKAGVPAVLAMQGDVTQKTVEKFMPVFFSELKEDGQIDRAMAVARGAVRDRADCWTPVLFMRIKSGQLWYAPGFGNEARSFERWESVESAIVDGYCTPILGPGLTEALLGTRHELARRLAKRSGAALVVHDRDDLPQVAQFMATDQGAAQYAVGELIKQLREELIERGIPGQTEDGRTASLDSLLMARLSQIQHVDETEPHLALARLPFDVYITTSPSDLLAATLRSVGRNPVVVSAPWRESLRKPKIPDDYEPDVKNPLLYHAFGRFDDPTSLVLTEDNYFDYLIGVTNTKRDIPPALRRVVEMVNARLASTTLLFLGFQTDDWNFRVLFRSIMHQQGGALRDQFVHVAVQVEPDEDGLARPERVRRYLETYFTRQVAQVSVFWGGVDDFVKQLCQRPGVADIQQGLGVAV